MPSENELKELGAFISGAFAARSTKMTPLKKLLETWTERLQRLEQERFGFTSEEEIGRVCGYESALEICIEELRELIENNTK
jgi:hypothetical protein